MTAGLGDNDGLCKLGQLLSHLYIGLVIGSACNEDSPFAVENLVDGFGDGFDAVKVVVELSVAVPLITAPLKLLVVMSVRVPLDSVPENVIVEPEATAIAPLMVGLDIVGVTRVVVYSVGEFSVVAVSVALEATSDP